MNYEFIFDKNFKEMTELNLSETEVRVISATILGGHNALFYGYKPERIIRAIKLLSGGIHIEEPSCDVRIEEFCGGGPNLSKGSISLANGGILLLKNLEDFKTSIIQMLRVPMETKNITLSRAGNTITHPCNFQLIASSQIYNNECDTQKVKAKELSVRKIAERCDIAFYCDSKDNFVVESFMDMTRLFETYKDRIYRSCVNVKNDGQIEDFSKLRLSDVALSEYPNVDIVTARVARTLASMSSHTLVWGSDIKEALYYKKSLPKINETELPF